MRSIHLLAFGTTLESQVVKQVRFTNFFPDVNSIDWRKYHLVSISFAGVIAAAVLSSIAALAAILIVVWFIKYKRRGVERDDGGETGESMNDSNMPRKMHRFQ